MSALAGLLRVSARYGSNLQCFMVERNRIIGAPFLHAEQTEIIMRDRVIGGNRERVCPKRLTVFPITSLSPCAPTQQRDQGARGEAENFAMPPPGSRQICRRPGERDKQTDMGKVGIAVCMSLYSHLNHADHWDEHYQIPEPAG